MDLSERKDGSPGRSRSPGNGGNSGFVASTPKSSSFGLRSFFRTPNSTSPRRRLFADESLKSTYTDKYLTAHTNLQSVNMSPLRQHHSTMTSHDTSFDPSEMMPASLATAGGGEALYEIDECIVNQLQEPDGEYIVSPKSKMNKHPTQKFTVIEHFHRLMKETLGERLYASLLKKGVLSKNLPDEIITRKIMDALELKNKLLFNSTNVMVSAIDKLSFIQAAGSFRGALRAAMSATANVKEECLEDTAAEEVAEYEGLFLKHDKPKPEIRVIGYVGVTNLDS